MRVDIYMEVKCICKNGWATSEQDFVWGIATSLSLLAMTNMPKQFDG